MVRLGHMQVLSATQETRPKILSVLPSLSPISQDFMSNWGESAELAAAVWAAAAAFEARDPRAMDLLVGLPATVSVGLRDWPARVVEVSGRLIRAQLVGSGRILTFGCARGGWRAVGAPHQRLHVGVSLGDPHRAEGELPDAGEGAE